MSDGDHDSPANPGVPAGRRTAPRPFHVSRARRLGVAACLLAIDSGPPFGQQAEVPGKPVASRSTGPRTSFWANPSSLNFDVLTKGPGARSIRAFVGGDFAGTSNGFRLRHAYMQVGRFLGGQTWSTFSHPDADHGDIDFEGVRAENVQRQAQFRYTRRVNPALRLATSARRSSGAPSTSTTSTSNPQTRTGARTVWV